jgi:protein translocase SecG subunit
MSLLITFLYILFVLAAIVLITVILLQEGKGGGFGEAFGGAGQQTFGVGASGINKFTAITAGVFLGAALTIHVLNRMGTESSVVGAGSVIEAPVNPGAGAAAPAGGPGAGGGGAPASGGAAGGATGGGTGGGAGDGGDEPR